MQIPFDVLSETYLAAASDASLATATVDEEEYSEEFMVRYRNQGKAPAEQEGGISGYEEEGEEDFDDYDSEDY